MPTEFFPGIFAAQTPSGAGVAVVFDSPHSGFDFPPDFSTIAPTKAIRTTCDVFVDELFGSAPNHGAALISGLFPRAYIDTNRDVGDIDPELVEGPLGQPIATTEYTRRGMGLVRRYALPGIPLYGCKLTPAEVRLRIDRYYTPYRRALEGQIARCLREWGCAWHVNCHSMKSRGNEMNVDRGSMRPDFVISDRNGLTANPDFTAWVAARFADMGYSVRRNEPYQGGDLIKSVGRPDKGVNSIQIEVNRGLYLDESTYEKSSGFPGLQANIERFITELAVYVKAQVKDRFSD